jgi:hypothetical protein
MSSDPWRPIADYEGLYEVSDRGEIRSLDRVLIKQNRRGGSYKAHHKGRIMRLTPDKDGYLQVSLCKNGLIKKRKVHKIVLETFDRPCPAGQETLHGAGGVSDNRWPENIKWGTHAENEFEKLESGTAQFGSRVYGSKLTEDIVRDSRRQVTFEYVSIGSLADEHGVDYHTMWMAVTCRSWKHVSL